MEKETPRFRVGVALPKKKQISLLTPYLLSLALGRSLDVVPVDPDLPLASQGPFHLLLHKIPPHPTWTSDLLSYATDNPDMLVVDHPNDIARLQNRLSMLEVVSGLSFPHCKEVLGIPRQVLLEDGGSALGRGLDLEFPMIAKPLLSDGGAGTHDLAIVFRNEGLLKLTPPVILQEFVNHGGVLFKVYVMGDHVKMVKRSSLPDVRGEDLKGREPLLPFSQISNTPSQNEDVSHQLDCPEMPSPCFVEKVARGLREATGLRLFNFDLIRDARVENLYLVIDINYFPGYEKLPSYEEIFIDFLLTLVQD